MSSWPLLCLVVALQWSVCAGASAQDTGGRGTPVKVFTLEAYRSAAAPQFSGKVEAGDSAELAFRVAGQLRDLNVIMGDMAQKGDVLAELDSTDYELNLQARAAEFELARLGAERAAKLFVKQLISEDQFDTAQTNMAISKARLEQASEQLSFCKLIAPFSGSIAFTYAMPSEVMPAHQAVLTLQDTTRLEIHFNLPPQFEPLLSGTGRATFFTVMFDLLPEQQLPADLKEVSLQPDPDTNSYPVTLMLKRPEGFSPGPGMSVKVSLHHPSLLTGSWVLPQEAMFDRAGAVAQVWRIDAASMQIHKTEISLDSDGAVSSGLHSGDRVVAAGVKRLREGQKVREWVREGGL